MCAEFTTRVAEEMRMDILQRSKGDQWTVKVSCYKNEFNSITSMRVIFNFSLMLLDLCK